MSEITDLKKKQKLALDKYGQQPENTGALWANMDLVNDLHQVVETMAGDRLIDGMLLPRFGVLSLILRTTPCYVYGHPAFKKLCKTAFTDGVHVFICDEFYEKMLKDVRESKGAEFGTEPLLLHELMHKMFNHVQRLRQFPKGLANRAADLSINTKLRSGFPEIEWCKTLRETGLGFKAGDIEKYIPLAEESIARELLAEEMKKQQEKQQKGDPNEKGQGQGGGSGGKPDPFQQGQGDGEPSQGEPGGEFGGDDDDHLIGMDQVIDALNDGGLDDARSLLGLPESSEEVEEIGRIMEENQDRQHEAIQQASAQASQSNGKYPGQHIVDAACEYMKGFSKGKLSWKLAMREMILGDGMKWKGSFETPADIAYVEEVEEDLGTALYLPVELAHKSEETVLVLIDTSGSVESKDIRAFLTEIFELKTASENMGDQASKVIIISGDTVMRGDPVELTEDNVDEMMSQGMKIFGRGGTDLAHTLKTALKLPLMKDENIRSVIYCTDLFDTPPRKADLGIEDHVNIVYVAAPSTASSHQEEFARAVESYARVVSIKEGVEVDLDDTQSMSVSPSKRTP